MFIIIKWNCFRDERYGLWASGLFYRIIFILQLPGKPFAKEIKSDSITLIWEKPQEKVDIYQVRFSLRNRETKWKFAYVDIEDNYATIRGLVANSEYIFQVRAVYEEQEGPYGPVSDVIKTHESSATMFLKFCVRQDSSTPSRYLLPIVENVSARNKETRTRQMILGNNNILMIVVCNTCRGHKCKIDVFLYIFSYLLSGINQIK